MTNGAREEAAAAALAQQAIPASVRSSLFTRLTEAAREREDSGKSERESRNATSPEPLRVRSPSSLTRMVMAEKARLDEEEAQDRQEDKGGKNRFAHEPWDWKLERNGERNREADEDEEEGEEVEVEAPVEAGGVEEADADPASPPLGKESPVMNIPDVPKSAAAAESLVA